MFLYLSKVVPPFFYPPGLSIVLLVLSAVLRKRLPKSAAALFIVGVVSLYALSTGIVGEALQRSLESAYPPVAIDALPKADAVVVLGGYLHAPNSQHMSAEFTESADRLRSAAQIIHAGKAPLVLLTGGNVLLLGAKGLPEAQVARGIMREWGLPLEAILIEERSRNTRENAVFSAPVLAAKGARRLILVTSAAHMRRAVAVFRRAGLAVVPFPTDYQSGWGEPELLLRWVPEAEQLWHSGRAVREWIGLAVYRLRGWA